MINMIVILDKSADENNINDIVGILLNRFKESNNLTGSATDKNYVSKKSLKKKYEEFIKTTPKEFLREFGINSFEDYVLEYWNVLGFVGNDPIVRYNPEALFEYFEIDDVYRKCDIDDYDIVEDIDYLLDKNGVLYEVEDNSSVPLGFIKILRKCNHNDFIVLVTGMD